MGGYNGDHQGSEVMSCDTDSIDIMDSKRRINNLSQGKRRLLISRAKKHLRKTEMSEKAQARALERPALERPFTSSDLGAKHRLTAYIVKKQGQEVTSAALRTFLQERLPYFMIPNNFHFLKEIPLTPNVKVDRQALHKLASRTSVNESEEAFEAPRNDIEDNLTAIWADVLGVQRVGVNDNFFELGGDSILSIQIISKAREKGLKLSVNQLFQNQTIAELATVIESENSEQSEQGPVVGKVPLTPIQNWFFEQGFRDPHHWNQTVLLEIAGDLSIPVLEKAIQLLLKHHDALRLSFVKKGNAWHQFNTESSPVVGKMAYLDLTEMHKSERSSAMEKMASEMHASLSLENGDLLRFLIVNLDASGPKQLFIISHHLVIDGVSWRILLEDLETICTMLCTQTTNMMPPKTDSYKRWAEILVKHAQSNSLRQEFHYWLACLQNSTADVPLDFNNIDENTNASERIVSMSLSIEETQSLLKEVPAAYNTHINDVLLSALSVTFQEWINSDSFMIGLEGHGREEIVEGLDLSRSVGWFTSFFPVVLPLGGSHDPEGVLKTMKERLRSIPNRGIGYGLLRYLHKDPKISKKLKAAPQPKILFNYLGQYDQMLFASKMFNLIPEPSGLGRSPLDHRSHVLEINAKVFQNRLEVIWTYSKNLHRQTTIENLARKFIEVLQSIISHCLSTDVGGLTPSDLPELDFTQEELDTFFSELDEPTS